MNDTSASALAAQFLAEQDFAQADRGYFREALLAILKDLPTVDAFYGPALDRSPASLDPVTRAILRLGSWELAERIDVPVRVVFDQCITLAHRFGASESHRFINAVLDGVARQLRAPGDERPGQALGRAMASEFELIAALPAAFLHQGPRCFWAPAMTPR